MQVDGDVTRLAAFDAFLQDVDVLPTYDCIEISGAADDLQVASVECDCAHANFICRGLCIRILFHEN